MRTGQNLDFRCESIFICLCRSSFVLCLSSLLAVSLPTLSSFLLHGIVAGQLFRERDKYNLQRVVGKQRMVVDFSPKSYLFCESNSARIGQNIQKKISLESYIFSDVVAYQFVKLHCKRNGSRKEDMHRSTWKENDQGSRRRVKRFRDFLFRI